MKDVRRKIIIILILVLMVVMTVLPLAMYIKG